MRVNVGGEWVTRWRGRWLWEPRLLLRYSLVHVRPVLDRGVAAHAFFGWPPVFRIGRLTWRTARSASDLLPVGLAVWRTMRQGRWR